MGACGCGDGFGRWRFTGPDDVTYTFDVYPGCDNCSTPIGVTIQQFTGAHHDEIIAPDPLPFRELGDCGDLGFVHDFALPMIIRETGDPRVTLDDGEVCKLSEILESEHVRRAVETNMERTIADWLSTPRETGNV